MIASAIAIIVSGLAIFVAPGAAVFAAARIRLPASDRLAYAFAASLAMLTAAFAACLAFGSSIDAAPPSVAAVTASFALLLRWLAPAPRSASAAADPSTQSTPAIQAVLAVLLIAAVIAAVVFAPLGSVDRWWYLAYVRSWLEAPALTLAEPFLATGRSFARFGVHPWLFGLALWSRMSGVDPVFLYERCAPVLVVLASCSAAFALARELFGSGRRVRLSVIATMLLWSGSVVPVLARAGEDKVLAAAALLPLCIAAFLRIARAPDRSGWILLAVAAAATAAVHALAYAFVLVILLPSAVALGTAPERRRRMVAAGALLGVIAIAPAVSGLVVRERLAEIGAELSEPGHPVVRVHEGRGRLIEFPIAGRSGGFVVSPRLLLHPLLLLALAGVPVVLLRPERDRARAAIRDAPRSVLLIATMLPLAIAFVPPLPSLAGDVIPPWMVYRVLWLLPVAPLVALTADWLATRFSRGEIAATLLLVALGLPVAAAGARDRLSEVRERVAEPRTTPFHLLVHAVRSLPLDAIVVAAPELAERLPALTARRVVGGLDRSTIVFSASRERGEARLRARAALLAGDDDAQALAAAAAVAPTHAIFDPRRKDATPRCRSMLLETTDYALCELDPSAREAGPPPSLPQATGIARSTSVARGECLPTAPRARRDLWSAAPAVVHCRIPLSDALRDRRDIVLRVETKTGRAVDEIRIEVRRTGGTLESRSTVRLSGDDAIALRMPPLSSPVSGGTDALDVKIESSFLPFVRPTLVELAATGSEAAGAAVP